MSRWFSSAGIILLLLAVVVACGDSDDGGGPGGEGRLTVVATTSIIGSLAEQVTGDQAQVTALIGPGVDPHLYSPAPDDVRTASEADLILMNGIGLDDYLVESIESAGASAPIIVVTDGIQLHEGGHTHDDGEGAHEDETEEGHGEFDPHVWQDPLRAKIMVDNIAAALGEIDPDNAAVYEENAATYKTTLDETDAKIQTLIDEIPPENRKLVTNHDGLGYFADRYGLEIVATVIPNLSTDADPSAGQIADLTDLLEQGQIPAIFTEQLVDPKIAEQLAHDTGVDIIPGLYTDSIGKDGSGAETLDGMLLENARMIAEGLG